MSMPPWTSGRTRTIGKDQDETTKLLAGVAAAVAAPSIAAGGTVFATAARKRSKKSELMKYFSH